jgi:hypothetical protein
MTIVSRQVAPEHLTALLRRANLLTTGEVVDVAVETARDTLVSRITRLRIACSGASPTVPSHVILKTERDGVDERMRDLGSREATFYDIVAPATPADVLPRCYEARSGSGQPWHLVLEDLTDSHEPAASWPIPPPVERVHAVVTAHARFHAAWWDDERLGISVGAFADQTGQLDRFVDALPRDFAIFADHLGDRLSAERRRIYERLIAAAPRLLTRYRSHRHLTLVHGDAHVWNSLLPRDPGRSDVRLLDWDSWRVDTASDDLAYMMALHWYPDWRRRHESEVLGRYHDVLVSEGVRGYSLEALRADYRSSVLWQITTPLWQANHALAPVIWWNNLERIMLAVDDLGCRELLD